MRTARQSKAADDHVQQSADCIIAPGCYVCDWNGHVLRVQAENGQTRRSLMVSIIGSRPLTVTRISDNPFIPLSEARLRASNLTEDALPASTAGRTSRASKRTAARRTSTRRGSARRAARTKTGSTRRSGSAGKRRKPARSRAFARAAASKGRRRAAARKTTARRTRRR